MLLIGLTLPFLPTALVDIGSPITWSENPNNLPSSPSNSTENFITEGEGDWVRDFSVSVSRIDLTFLNSVLNILWGSGVLVMLILTIHSWMNLQRIKKSINFIENQVVQTLFQNCKYRLRISKKVMLVESPLIKSPVTFGIFKIYIVLPRNAEIWLSRDELTYIFLHELHHFKYKDIATNHIVNLFQILYWYNPLIWVAFREMRLDREIACDSAVLKMLNHKHYSAYGNTILTFANKSFFENRFSTANHLVSSRKQLRNRIEKIANYSTESRLLKWKSIIIFVLLIGIVISQIPIVSAMSDREDRIHFDHPQTIEEDLSNYFHGYDASFVLYDLRKAQYLIYNKDKSMLRVSPNSTYKIYSALFALDSGVISTRDSLLKWDKEEHSFEEWNQNQNLYTAMKNSVTWYFQSLDQQMPKQTIQTYVDKIHYGNQDVSAGVKNYWLESSLKISPIEQVQTLKDFYTNQFDFNEQHIALIKDTIKLETKNNATIYGKTGTGTVNNKHVNGWFIGYVESQNNTFFFATNIKSDHHAKGSIAEDITKSILEDKVIY